VSTDTQSTDRFEERLLADILDDFADITATPSPISGAGRSHHRVSARRAVSVAVTGAAAAALVVGGLVTVGSRGAVSTATHAGHGRTTGQTLLYRLASVSVATAPAEGRYVVLAETDTETGLAGESERTSVIDTQTGASTTYQRAAPLDDQAPDPTYTDIPAVLTEGPDPTSTEAWYSALPTDPSALRAKLLAVAKQQQAQAVAETDEQAAKVGKTLPAGDGQPMLSDDDYVYQEADTLLWSPLVQPALRSALYKVLAATSGFTITSDATDPSGRPAIAMVRHYTGVTETDTTYEDPATGAVLAQIWQGGSDTITAVYKPVTSSDTVPVNPYTS
jgi:hypothetical protein